MLARQNASSEFAGGSSHRRKAVHMPPDDAHCQQRVIDSIDGRATGVRQHLGRIHRPKQLPSAILVDCQIKHNRVSRQHAYLMEQVGHGQT